MVALVTTPVTLMMVTAIFACVEVTPVPPVGQRDPDGEELDSLALNAVREPAREAAEAPANELRRTTVAATETPATLPTLLRQSRTKGQVCCSSLKRSLPLWAEGEPAVDLLAWSDAALPRPMNPQPSEIGIVAT